MASIESLNQRRRLVPFAANLEDSMRELDRVGARRRSPIVVVKFLNQRVLHEHISVQSSPYPSNRTVMESNESSAFEADASNGLDFLMFC